MNLTCVPDEIFYTICQFIKMNTLISNRQVSKKFKQLTDNILNTFNIKYLITYFCENNIRGVIACLHKMSLTDDLYTNINLLKKMRDFCDKINYRGIANFLDTHFKYINTYEKNSDSDLVKFAVINNYENIVEKIVTRYGNYYVLYVTTIIHNKQWASKYIDICLDVKYNYDNFSSFKLKKELLVNTYYDRKQYEYYDNTPEHILFLKECCFRKINISEDDFTRILNKIQTLDNLEQIKEIIKDSHDILPEITSSIGRNLIIMDSIIDIHYSYILQVSASNILDMCFSENSRTHKFLLELALKFGFKYNKFDVHDLRNILFNKSLNPFIIMSQITNHYDQDLLIDLLTISIFPLVEKQNTYFIPSNTKSEKNYVISIMDMIIKKINNTDTLPNEFLFFLINMQMHETFIKIINKRTKKFTDDDELLIISLKNMNKVSCYSLINNFFPKINISHLFVLTTKKNATKWHPDQSDLTYDKFNKLWCVGKGYY